MRAFDYLIMFSLISVAPFWQSGLDELSPGLGSALLILLFIAAIRTASSKVDKTNNPR